MKILVFTKTVTSTLTFPTEVVTDSDVTTKTLDEVRELLSWNEEDLSLTVDRVMELLEDGDEFEFQTQLEASRNTHFYKFLKL